MDGELKVHNTQLALEYCKNNPIVENISSNSQDYRS
jgi:hypothetical protein